MHKIPQLFVVVFFKLRFVVFDGKIHEMIFYDKHWMCPVEIDIQ